MTPGQCLYAKNMNSHWIDTWLSTERFAPYLSHCGGNRQAALELYDWNASLSCSLFKDITHFEISLRNAYNQAFENKWQGPNHWLLDKNSPVRKEIIRKARVQKKKKDSDINFENRKNIRLAINRAGGRTAAPGKILAELSFGFWSSLTASNREQFLWTPYLRFAYPKGTDRKTVDVKLELIRQVRNRIAHIEPIYYSIAKLNYSPYTFPKTLFEVFSMLSEEASNHTQMKSNFLNILNSKPS